MVDDIEPTTPAGLTDSRYDSSRGQLSHEEARLKVEKALSGVNEGEDEVELRENPVLIEAAMKIHERQKALIEDMKRADFLTDRQGKKVFDTLVAPDNTARISENDFTTEYWIYNNEPSGSYVGIGIEETQVYPKEQEGRIRESYRVYELFTGDVKEINPAIPAEDPMGDSRKLAALLGVDTNIVLRVSDIDNNRPDIRTNTWLLFGKDGKIGKIERFLFDEEKPLQHGEVLSGSFQEENQLVRGQATVHDLVMASGALGKMEGFMAAKQQAPGK